MGGHAVLPALLMSLPQKTGRTFQASCELGKVLRALRSHKSVLAHCAAQRIHRSLTVTKVLAWPVPRDDLAACMGSLCASAGVPSYANPFTADFKQMAAGQANGRTVPALKAPVLTSCCSMTAEEYLNTVSPISQSVKEVAPLHVD